jgi:hypothetical protein
MTERNDPQSEKPGNEPFDYTDWHKNLWADKTIGEIIVMADKLREKPES